MMSPSRAEGFKACDFVTLAKTYYNILDDLWGQPIKMIQVVSTSEFHEY